MLKPLGKLRDRHFSADMTKFNLPDIREKVLEEASLPKGRRKTNFFEKVKEGQNKADSSILINCENIKISIVTKDDENETNLIERDSLEIEQIYISKENQTSGVYYGSPALWLKKRKYQSEKENSYLANFKKIDEPYVSPCKEEIIEKNEKKIKMSNRSFLNEAIERTRNAVDLHYKPKNLFKTLITNSKYADREKKFNNIINHLESKVLSTTENREKTEIDEIIVYMKLIRIPRFQISIFKV